MRGFVQIYTGNGKGKTTAAIGLSIRAAGAGLKVFIAQFLKKGDYGEIKTLDKFSDLIDVELIGTDVGRGGVPGLTIDIDRHRQIRVAVEIHSRDAPQGKRVRT